MPHGPIDREQAEAVVTGLAACNCTMQPWVETDDGMQCTACGRLYHLKPRPYAYDIFNGGRRAGKRNAIWDW